ncbi:MAG: hypothetical protein WCO56_20500 [Verrucomicrobiota bacterium]
MNDPEKLIADYLDNGLIERERVELNAWLKADPANLRRFTEAVLFEQQIRAATRASAAHRAAAEFAPQRLWPMIPSRFIRWLSWRPLVAGVVLGMFCASVAWAYVSPHAPRAVKRLLPLANAGFEDGVAPLPNGVPVTFGVWSGDCAEVVEAQQGIVPREGKRMFRFLRSNSTQPSSSAPPYNGNIYQLVDVRAWRETIAGGTSVVDWSAWFNYAPKASSERPKFEASMWAFAGDPALVQKNWVEKLHQELAYSSWNIVADDDPQSWQPIAGSMIVPPDTDFLVIELKVIPQNPVPVDGVVTFADHYADDVQLVLCTNTREQPLKLTSPHR